MKWLSTEYSHVEEFGHSQILGLAWFPLSAFSLLFRNMGIRSPRGLGIVWIFASQEIFSNP